MGEIGSMKKLIPFIILLFTCFQSVRANPIRIFVFSEIFFDSLNWKIELHLTEPFGQYLLDEWRLITTTDTAYFKNGIVLDSNYLIITPESLTTTLFIDRNGDCLEIYYQGNLIDQIRFGNAGFISAPRPGESICLRLFSDEYQRYFYYLDKTPTLGYPNDSTNARGTISGTVTDSAGYPLDSVKVVYDYWYWMGYRNDIYALSDSSGNFVFTDYARFNVLKMQKDDYADKTVSVQVWPDSNTDISAVKLITGIVDDHSLLLWEYKLEQSYPNPFNPRTKVSFVIGSPACRSPAERDAGGSFVRLKIFNMLGEEVASLVNEVMPPGEYTIEWNAEGVASGIYFYRLVAGDFIETKKMVLIR
jgi:hypothetical protein